MSSPLHFPCLIALSLYLSTSAQTGIPNFEVDKRVGCRPLTVHITNKSKAINIFYIYGDGNSGLRLDHIYTRAGHYNLIQVVSGTDAISVFDTSEIEVFEPEPIRFKSASCNDKTLTLELLPENYYTAFVVDYGDRTIDTILRSNMLKHDYPDSKSYTLRIRAGFEDSAKISLSNCAHFQTEVRPAGTIAKPEIRNIEIKENRTIAIDYQVSADYQSVLIHNGRVLKLDSSKSHADLACLTLENTNRFQIKTRLNSDLKNLSRLGLLCSENQKLVSDTFTLPALKLTRRALLYIDVIGENLIPEAPRPIAFPIQEIRLFKNGLLLADHLSNPIAETNSLKRSDIYQLAYLNACTDDTLWTNKAANILLTGNLVSDGNYVELRWTDNKSFPDIIYSIRDLEDVRILKKVVDSVSESLVYLHRDLNDNQPRFSYQIEAFSPRYGLRFRSNILTLYRDLELQIPDAFTPNGDGVNDIFRILNSNIASLQMEIFNIWGNKIFTADQSGWNGKLNGQTAEAGVYYYIVEVESLQGQIIHKKGSFLLVR